MLLPQRADIRFEPLLPYPSKHRAVFPRHGQLGKELGNRGDPLPASGDLFVGRDELGNIQFVAGEGYLASGTALGILQRTGGKSAYV